MHPGGPFWAKRDDGAWSIPKGEYEDGEEPLAGALREFEEEIGSALDAAGELVDLGEVRQRNRKVVTAWAAEGDLDASAVRSNTFEMEWPPRSGRQAGVPGDRSRGVVHARAGAREADRGAGRVPRPAGGAASRRPGAAATR